MYSEIAAIVEEKRQADAEKGLEIAQILEGFVKRKVGQLLARSLF